MTKLNGIDSLITELNHFVDSSSSLQFLEINGVPNETEILKTLIELESNCYKIPINLNSIYSKAIIESYNRYWKTVIKHCEKKGLGNVSSNEILKLTFGLHPGCITDTSVKDSILLCLTLLLDNKRKSTNQMNLEMIKNYLFKYFIWIDEIIGTILKGNYNYVSLSGNLKKDHFDFIYLLLNSIKTIKAIYFNNNKINYETNIFFDSNFFVCVNLDLNLDKSYSDYLIELENSKISNNFDSVDTIAKKATEEIVEVLYNDGTAISIPWVYEDYGVNIINVNSTYNELTRYWNEPAYFRLGYNLLDNKLNVPVFFSSIDGVIDDIEKYWLEYDIFKSCDNILYFENESLLTEKCELLNRPIAFFTDGFRYDDIKKLKFYKYNMLRSKIENLLFDCLNELCFGNYLNFDLKDIDKYYLILDVYFSIPSVFLNSLQNYDYGKSIPKVIIYKDGSSVFNNRELILLCFLNRLGFDILIFNPSGYRLLQDTLNFNLINYLRLDKFISNLVVPSIINNVPIEKPGFLRRFFNS